MRLKHLIEDRNMLLKMIKNDFKTRNLGSFLGIFWSFINPLITILTFWFVFEVGFRSGPVQDVPFILWLVAGIIPWFYFSESVGAATYAVIDNAYLVKKVRFRVGYLPLIKISVSLFIHLFFIALAIILFSVYNYYPSIYTLDLLFYLVSATFLIIGFTYITSSIVVFFRDMGQIVGIIIQFGFWLTPIFWNSDIIPEKYSLVFKLNPMYYVVNGYRNAFIYKIHFWEDIYSLSFFLIQVTVTLLAGIFLFRKLKPNFADVL